MTAAQHPVPVGPRVPAMRPRSLPAVIARRALPFVMSSAAAVVTTLAAERALANLALRAADRAPSVVPSRSAPNAGLYRTTHVETYVIERIIRQR